MGQTKDVVTVDELTGRSVLSLSSGNVLGGVRDVFIDPLNGVTAGFSLTAPDGSTRELPYDQLHSFGRDAIMVHSDDSVASADTPRLDSMPRAHELVGTKIITDAGNFLGQITAIHVTLSPPPSVIYEIQESLLDRLLGRKLYLLSSTAYALSEDRQRLILPDEASSLAAPSLEKLFDDEGMRVRSISPNLPSELRHEDDTVVVLPADDEDETVVRAVDEDETVVRFRRRTGS